MKKKKLFEVSLINKTYSKTIQDTTKFYTSDTALELGFELLEVEYNFNSAEILLLNVDDRSLVTRDVTKDASGFTYELEDDIIDHFGEWKAQLKFEKDGEIYVSSPVIFRIENDLSNDRPPQLSDVQSWVSLKRYADGLVDELKQAVEESVANVEAMDDTFKANELERDKAEKERQSRFEDAESERDETFNTNEDIRQTKELEREKDESTRQQAESQRQSTFEVNEQERQTTFETAEQERQSAELIRVENEKQRNLTSVDEFIKLQEAIGGRNLTRGNTDVIRASVSGDNRAVMLVAFGVRNFKANTDYTVSLDLKVQEGIKAFNYNYLWASAQDTLGNVNIGSINVIDDGNWHRYTKTFNFPNDRYGEVRLGIDSRQASVASNIPIEFAKWKLEEGSVATPYTKAPEDYTSVSKNDYYSHVKMMNEFKNNQFNQLKKAVIALGGTI